MVTDRLKILILRRALMIDHFQGLPDLPLLGFAILAIGIVIGIVLVLMAILETPISWPLNSATTLAGRVAQRGMQ